MSTDELKTRRVDYDKVAAFLLGPEHIQPRVLDLTEWKARDYVTRPNWANVPKVNSLYVAHAPEIVRVPEQRKHTFRFTDTLSWLDVALRVLKHIQWSLEGAKAQRLNVKRLLPTQRAEKQFRTEENLSCIDEYMVP